ncbi:MAG TPA: multidrug transporter AcrB [Bacteroidales bacterium]|nr:multidrug transporter AcrB [Bacteroidales bacterium]
MSIYSSAVKRPITTLMVFVAIVAFGVFSLREMPIDLYPEIDPPFISVITVYPGAAASDIETNVTRPIEDNLSTVANLRNITSTSRENVSSISLEFEYGTNLDESTNEIRDILGRLARILPEDIEQPTVFRFSADMIPVMMLSATARESYPALSKIIDDIIINPLNRIDGVGTVMMFGGPVREVQVNIDPQRLEAMNLTLEQVGMALSSENIALPTGNLRMGQIDYPLRFTGEFTSSEQIQNIVIGNFMGNPVYVRDVATVNDTLRELTIKETMDREQGLRFMVMKQSGANTVQISREVDRQLPALLEQLPPDITVEKIFDTSEFIVDAINNLTNVLYYAAVFVTLVVLFFLGKWRATIIIILTIPVSLITGFIYLYLTGNSINFISLSSLAIAMGMVVDDAIVVLENITKKIELGATPKEASVYGTNEVGLAVVASTLTVVAVFLPLTMIGGLMGIFFKQLGWIVTITVSVSTIAAMTLTPMLSSIMLEANSGKRRGLGTRVSGFIEGILGGIDKFYLATLKVALSNKIKTFIAAIVIFAASFLLVPYIDTGFFPQTDESRLNATVELPAGLRLTESVKIAERMQDMIEANFPEIDMISSSTGTETGNVMFGGGREGSNVINFIFRLIPASERDRTVWEIADEIRTDFAAFPEVVRFSVTAGQGGFGGSPVEIEIFGEDFNTTSQFAKDLEQRMKQIPGLRDISISRGDERPELRIVPDQQRMAMLGVTTTMAAQAIRNRVEGMIATRFREGGEEYNVVVRSKEEFRNTIADIENIAIMNQTGRLVRVKEFATIEEFYSPPNIERKNRQRYLLVTSDLFGRSLGDVTTDIQAQLDQMETPPGMAVIFGGQIREQQEAFADLAFLLLLSIFLVYVVMAAQFESFRMPIIIMISIPFAFTGVLLALFITGMELNVISMIGSVILVGIVVKNSIVMIDYTNLLVARGYSVYDSVIMSGSSRLRPVLMTTLTTLLAMIPLAISRAEGSEIWAPMGVAVIGGLTFSTLITLVLVPVFYYAFGSRKYRKGKSERQIGQLS